MEKKFLNEESYQKTKNKIKVVALIILVIGILIGGSLIATGIRKQNEINSKYSEENKQKIASQLEVEKQNITNKKTEIENKIKPIEDQIKSLERVSFNGFDAAYYERKDKIEELQKSISSDKKTILVIDDVLEDSNFACKFDGKTNFVTSQYCSLSNQLNDISSDFNKSFDSRDSIPFYMFGGFIIVASGMISLSVYMFAKRREILAFGAQTIIPVAKEVVDDVAPTIGKAGATIAKEMAPVYGDIAKEISKGIKEGINETNQKED